jgi:hypothetical protein
MVPTLKIPKESLKDNGFMNGYSYEAHREVHYENCVYLLFKPKNLDKFREFLDSEYERTKNVIEDYDYPDGYVVIVYKLDENFKDDFKLIRKGKYSRTSVAFQNLFPKIVKIIKGGLHRDEISLQYRVFNRTQDLVDFWERKFDIEFTDDMEVWDGFFVTNETLDIEKIRESCTTKI